MGRQINPRGLMISINTAPCAHNCGYCSTGLKTLSGVSFSRLAKLVERFSEWKLSEKRADFAIDFGIGHSHNVDLHTLKHVKYLREKLGHGQRSQSLYLGGLKMRPMSEMYDWLKVRRDEIGIDSVHASLAGHSAVHDRWNGRPGDFDFLFQTMQIAADLGLQVRQRLFVVKSTVPLLDELAKQLDQIEAATERYFSLFFYRGLGVNLEEERITEELRQRLPPHVHGYEPHSECWYSEREWIEIAKSAHDDEPQDLYLKLHLNESIIDQMEALSCDEIISDLEIRTRAIYAAIPSRQELCEHASDSSNKRIYSDYADIENKWFDRHLTIKPMAIERRLTHLWKDW